MRLRSTRGVEVLLAAVGWMHPEVRSVYWVSYFLTEGCGCQLAAEHSKLARDRPWAARSKWLATTSRANSIWLVQLEVRRRMSWSDGALRRHATFGGGDRLVGRLGSVPVLLCLPAREARHGGGGRSSWWVEATCALTTT